MLAYDLLFGDERDALRPWADARTPVIRSDDAIRAGWLGAHGPGIAVRSWPRNPESGLPMWHVFTLSLPPDYQRRGPDLPAVSFFASDTSEWDPPAVVSRAGSTPTLPPPQAPQPWDQPEPHPQVTVFTDQLGLSFAAIWLTQEEFDADPKLPPDETRWPGGQPPADRREFLETRLYYRTTPIWLVDRQDPNAGVAPSEDTAGGYEPPYDADFNERPWVPAIRSHLHLGGTSFPYQSLPPLSPFYLEFSALAACNFGGGRAQLDLERGFFTWAC